EENQGESGAQRIHLPTSGGGEPLVNEDRAQADTAHDQVLRLPFVAELAKSSVRNCAGSLATSATNLCCLARARQPAKLKLSHPHADPARSEERRVGKECRSRWSEDD